MRSPLTMIIAALTLSACAPAPEADTAANDAPPTITIEAGRKAPQPILSELPETIPTEYQELAAKLASLGGVAPDAIGPAPAGGLIEARWGLTMGYISPDLTTMVIQGDMISLESGENLSEGSRRATRKTALAQVSDENSIIFAPENPKHTVTVFTDIDCGYCRKLHSEMADYNAEGIAIRYVAFPRSGMGTESSRKSEAVWCAKDRNAAMDQAKSGDPMQGAPSDCANPVAQQYALGSEVGLTGTPMMILENGAVVSGYLPADALAAQLAALDG